MREAGARGRARPRHGGAGILEAVRDVVHVVAQQSRNAHVATHAARFGSVGFPAIHALCLGSGQSEPVNAPVGGDSSAPRLRDLVRDPSRSSRSVAQFAQMDPVVPHSETDRILKEYDARCDRLRREGQGQEDYIGYIHPADSDVWWDASIDDLVDQDIDYQVEVMGIYAHEYEPRIRRAKWRVAFRLVVIALYWRKISALHGSAGYRRVAEAWGRTCWES